MYQRYFSAFQKQVAKGEKKKEELKESVADKKVNVAVTQHDSIDRKSTRLNSSHSGEARMPSSA